jgi:hypothetical protein
MVSLKWFTIAWTCSSSPNLCEIITGHINPEIVFRRALVLANSRDDVMIDNILSHPVGPIPVSMFHEDGTMRKSCKSSAVVGSKVSKGSMLLCIHELK